jgi:DNA helicase II / ATP-dependent DNA helicase PcrA
VRQIADRAGYLEDLPDDLGNQELTRQNDLARFVRLAEEFDDGTKTAAEFAADVQARFGTDGGRGINLMTYHRAKGLEFEAVFLPRVQDGELPFKRSKSEDAIAEERRLFYVGITRAKTHLALTWVNDGKLKASSFIGELVEGRARSAADPAPVLDEARSDEPVDPLVDELKRWRKERAGADNVPPYVVFHDTTLVEIAHRRPRDLVELETVSGIGPAKLDRYGTDIIEIIGKLA